MKNGQIFAHKSTARGGLDLEYLDETSRRKVSLRERADMEQQIGKKLKSLYRLCVEGNARTGPRWRIPASQHPYQSGRHEHALPALQRPAQASHY